MTIGKNTFVHPTALIGENVNIGDNCYIGPYCVIGFPAEWKGREAEDKGVLIGSNARITKLVTIDSGVDKITIVGSDTYIMAHAHIGHDAIVYSGTTISCGAKIGGHAIVGEYSNIGLNAVLHQKCIVPEGCMIGASSFVGKKSKLQPGYKYAGVPVRELGPNVKS